MSELIGVYGAGGFGREVMPLVRSQCAGQDAHFVFVDDANKRVEVNGHPILSWAAFLAAPASSRSVTIAIASSAVREKLAERCAKAGVSLINVKADNAQIGDAVVIGEGAILQAFTFITGNSRIGRHFHANHHSYVSHDCIIGDFVTFAPGVHCNGNISIGDHVYIGSGAVIRQGSPERRITIGAEAFIGMGAVVTKDVPPGVTVIGNPARPMAKD